MNKELHPVSLVGAGPGDPELLTVRALKRIEAADVVLADDLIDARVLALVRAACCAWASAAAASRRTRASSTR
jgi:siroheme synthase